MISRFFSFVFRLLMGIVFVAGIVGAVATKHFVHGTPKHVHLVSYGAIAVSTVAGSYLARKEPLKSWLSTRPVLWFLFLFNLAVAVAAPFFIHGSQGIGTAAGMGIVSLGAGVGLLKSRKSTAPVRARAGTHRR